MRGKGIGLVASGMIAGIFIGSHMVGAIGASAPCGTATPIAKATVAPTSAIGAHKIRLLYRYVSDSKTEDEFGDSKEFRFRGAFTLWAQVQPLDPTKVANASSICVSGEVGNSSCIDKTWAIDVGGKAITGSVRVTDLKCQFGCHIYVSAENMKWDARILQ